MTKKIARKLSVETKESFKNDKIVFCFIIFSSSKFVEFLLVKFNSFFIKCEYKKKKKSNVNVIIMELTVSLDNYVTLKKELIFEFNKEHLKFKFLYILFKKKKLSVSFFENNYMDDFKEENFKFLNKFNMHYLLIRNVFLFKFLFLLWYIIIIVINKLNCVILNKLKNVDYTPSC